MIGSGPLTSAWRCRKRWTEELGAYGKPTNECRGSGGHNPIRHLRVKTEKDPGDETVYSTRETCVCVQKGFPICSSTRLFFVFFPSDNCCCRCCTPSHVPILKLYRPFLEGQSVNSVRGDVSANRAGARSLIG